MALGGVHLAVCACVISMITAGCGGSSSSGSSGKYSVASFKEFAAPGAGNVPGSVPAGVWPDDVTGDAAGNIWFAEHHSNEIGCMSPAGIYKGYPVPTANGEMDGITLDSTRNVVYVTETANNKIARLDIGTGTVTEISMPRPNSVPGDLVHTPDGTVYLTEGYEGGPVRLARLDPNSLQITEYTPTIPRNGGDDLVLAPNGDIWYVYYADNRICKFSNGAFTEVVLPRPNVVPTNIAMDSQGLAVGLRAGR